MILNIRQWQRRIGFYKTAPPMIIENGRGQMILNIRQWQRRIGFYKTARLRQIAGQKAAPMADIIDYTLDQPRQKRQRKAIRSPAQITAGDDHVQMILQVLPDPRQVMHHRNPVSCQLGPWPDPGQQ